MLPRAGEVLERLGLGAPAVRAISTAYKSAPQTFFVRAHEGCFCLRRLPGDDDEFLRACIRHLGGRFDGIPGLVKGPFVVGGHTYVLTEWVIGRPPRLGCQGDATRVGELLARFHLASSGLQVSHRSSWRNQWGRFPAHAQRTVGKLCRLHRQVRRGPGSEFDQEFLARYPRLMALAEEALAALEERTYHAAVSEASAWGGFIHGDMHAGNILMAPGRAVLVDLECWRREVPVYDLYQLLRTQSYSLSMFDAVQRAYQEVMPLSQCQRATLTALCRFPGAPISTVTGFYKRTDRRDVGQWIQRLSLQMSQAEMASAAITDRPTWPWAG